MSGTNNVPNLPGSYPDRIGDRSNLGPVRLFLGAVVVAHILSAVQPRVCALCFGACQDNCRLIYAADG